MAGLSLAKASASLESAQDLRTLFSLSWVLLRRIFFPFWLGAFAGLRTAELLRLNWKDVELTRGYIHVSAANSKTAQRRLVTLVPNLVKLELTRCQFRVLAHSQNTETTHTGLKHSIASGVLT
jgi:integrase